jgi:tyrosyl-DNA phosphodiesterase 2
MVAAVAGYPVRSVPRRRYPLRVAPTSRLVFSAFDGVAWREGRKPPAQPPSSSLTIATWNLWFSDFWQEERLRAALGELRAHDPDVIALQEVVRDTLQIVCEEPWVRERYAISDPTGDTLAAYGVVMLTKLPVIEAALVELPSEMARALLVAELAASGRRIFAATVHLESLRRSAARRGEQLAIVQDALRETGADSIVVGDFNFCSTWREENDRMGEDFVDVWAELRGDDPGWTEDSGANAMLREAKGTAKHVRFDRVFVRSPRGGLCPVSIERLGTAPIAPAVPDVFPSDHFGLVARLERRPARR